MNLRAAAATPVLVLALLGACSDDDDEGIQQVVTTDEVSGISVALHGDAEFQSQETTTPAGPITVRFYIAETNGGQLASSLSVFEVSAEQGGFDLDGAVDGAASGSGGELVDSSEIEFEGHEGRDFEVDVTDPNGNEGLLHARVLFTGEHVVQLQALGPDSREEQIVELFDQLISTLDLAA
jgi:hypothetical protein